MNNKEALLLAKKFTPHVDVYNSKYKYRHEIAFELNGHENIGIELGVAKGIYSRRMVDSGIFRKFFGVDAYSDIHDTKEYIDALKYISFDKSEYRLIRSHFDESVALFPANYFDFIYVDGFAHSGEEGGKTFIDWWPKLKIGGIMGGDDYHSDWPLVMWAVNEFSLEVNEKLMVTTEIENEPHSKYPSWYLRKNKKSHAAINKVLYAISQKEKKRIHWQRTSKLSKFQRILESKLRIVIASIKNYMRGL